MRAAGWTRGLFPVVYAGAELVLDNHLTPTGMAFILAFPLLCMLGVPAGLGKAASRLPACPKIFSLVFTLFIIFEVQRI